jgi:uncharacterized membrane protein
MRSDNDPASEPPLFSATLTPHRSLSRNGFRLLMALLGGVGLIVGLVFVSVGAWPVGGFLGLDVALIYWAFAANYRAARAYEQITITGSEICLRKVCHRGKAAQWTLNPLWTRIDREAHEEFGLLGLFLVSRGRRITVASCLGPNEKARFAAALSSALAEAKRGPTRTAIS